MLKIERREQQKRDNGASLSFTEWIVDPILAFVSIRRRFQEVVGAFVAGQGFGDSRVLR